MMEGEEQSLLPTEEASEKRRLHLSQKIAFGVGHVMNDICAAMWFSYTLLFFKVVLGMPPLLAGIMLLTGQVADALATPIVGIFADRCGSRKTWHLLGTGLVMATFPLIFSPCPGCQESPTSPTPSPQPTVDPTDPTDPKPWAHLSLDELWLRGLYYAALIVIFQSGWAVTQISHLALIPDLSPIQAERSELTAIRYTSSVSSGVFMYLTAWVVLRVTGSAKSLGSGDEYKFRDIVLIGIVVGGIFSAYFQWFLKPPRIMTTIDNVPGSVQLQSDDSFFKRPLLYQVGILYMASRLFLTLTLVYMPFYLVESLEEHAEAIATVPLVSFIASILTALLVKQLNRWIGHQVIYLAGGLLSIAACVWIGIGADIVKHDGELYGLATLIGVSSSVTTVASLCLTADLIGSNVEHGAFVYSVVIFADKLVNGVVVVIIEEMKCDNYVECPHYYRDVLAFACGSSAVFGLISLSTLFNRNLRSNELNDVETSGSSSPTDS